MKKKWKRFILLFVVLIGIGVAYYGHQQVSGSDTSLKKNCGWVSKRRSGRYF
ncbi:hypothetical protein GCM10019815_20130 [Pediococcus damnosus]|nr:hypothetical protein PDA01_03100 [Pediococcus damnosus]